MLKRKYFFTYKYFPIPSIFIVEGFSYFRFKTRQELKKDLLFYFEKLLAILKKKNNLQCNWYSTRSLSSFDYHIQEKGGIVDNMGNVHTTAKSYKNYLKENDLVIKDWSDSSNKPKQQLSDRADVAKIVNKYV